VILVGAKMLRSGSAGKSCSTDFISDVIHSSNILEKDMTENEAEDNRPYVVVVNDEEQYSIWPEGRDIPAGWKAAGKSGSKQECLEYIESVWTDMRPLSLRRAMENQ